jgi:hypothetical protein
MNILDLPNEILVHIASFLKIKQLINFSKSCPIFENIFIYLIEHKLDNNDIICHLMTNAYFITYNDVMDCSNKYYLLSLLIKSNKKYVIPSEERFISECISRKCELAKIYLNKLYDRIPGKYFDTSFNFPIERYDFYMSSYRHILFNNYKMFEFLHEKIKLLSDDEFKKIAFVEYWNNNVRPYTLYIDEHFRRKIITHDYAKQFIKAIYANRIRFDYYRNVFARLLNEKYMSFDDIFNWIEEQRHVSMEFVDL